jgi:hypothetical protein
MAELKTSNSAAEFKNVPAEVLGVALSYVQDPKELLRLRALGTRWYNAVTCLTEEIITAQIFAGGAWRPGPRRTWILNRILLCHLPNVSTPILESIRSMDFSHWRNEPPKVFVKLFTVHFPQLQGIKLVANAQEPFRSVVKSYYHALDSVSFESGLTERGLSELSSFRNLRSLNLRSFVVTEVGFQCLAKLNKLALLTLRITWWLTISPFRWMAHFPDLEYLDLQMESSSGKIDARLLPNAMLQLPRLTYLNLGGWEIGDRHVGFFAQLRQLRSIHFSSYARCLNDAGIGSLHFSFLRRLAIPMSKLTDAGVDDLVSRFPDLECLDVGFCTAITDRAAQELTKLCGLRSVSLKGCCKLTSACLRSLKSFPELTFLDLGHSSWLNDEALKKLKDFPKLELLNLDLCRDISPSGFAQLAHFQCLTGISLGLLGVKQHKDVVYQALSTMKKLKLVNLSSNNTTIPQLEMLAQIPGLRLVKFSGCHLLRSGFEEFERRSGLTVMNELATYVPDPIEVPESWSR